MAGWFVLDRDILDHPLLRDGDRFRAWCWLIGRACWQPTPFDINGRTIMLQRGQVCVSRNQLAAEWHWPPTNVSRFLTRLKTELMIGMETGQGRTVITICNYSKYQDVSRETGQATGPETGQRADKQRTTKEPANHGTKKTKSGAKAPSARARGAPLEGVGITISDDDWEDFRDHRDKLKAPMTPRAERAIVKRLEAIHAKHGHDPAVVLDQSIRKGWRDVFELEDNTTAPPPSLDREVPW